MTRPTLGREASTTPPGPDPFPSVLAVALDRSARGATRVPPSGPVATPRGGAHPIHPGAASRRPGRTGATGPGPHRVLAAAARPAAGDTPGPARDHLIETVEPAVRPVWWTFLQVGDGAARRRLIEYYGPLVRGVGAKLAVRLPSSIELSDLLQSGTFGLMDAVDRFDPARGAPFEGYAVQRIRGAMLDELRAQDWVPRAVRARTREIDRARETVQARLGRPATDRELAVELGIGTRELRASTRPVHLVSVEEIAEPGPSGRAGPAAVADLDADPFQTAARRETSAELRAAIGQLGERDRLVLRLYYLEDRTLAQIGAVLGVTESRVCQLHTRMVGRLRGRMERALAG